jgi:hypothetical protein
LAWVIHDLREFVPLDYQLLQKNLGRISPGFELSMN